MHLLTRHSFSFDGCIFLARIHDTTDIRTGMRDSRIHDPVIVRSVSNNV